MKPDRDRFGQRAFCRRQVVGQHAALPGGDRCEFGIAAADQPHLGAPGRLAATAAVAVAAAPHRRDGDPVAGPEPGHAACRSATTSPANSWPSTMPWPTPKVTGSSVMCRSEPQMPQAATRSSTSSSAGSGLCRSSDAQRLADAVEDGGFHLPILQQRSSCREPGGVDHLADQAPDAAAGEQRHEQGHQAQHHEVGRAVLAEPAVGEEVDERADQHALRCEPSPPTMTMKIAMLAQFGS